MFCCTSHVVSTPRMKRLLHKDLDFVLEVGVVWPRGPRPRTRAHTHRLDKGNARHRSLPFSLKNKGNPVICTMDQPGEHHAECKTPGREKQILPDRKSVV